MRRARPGEELVTPWHKIFVSFLPRQSWEQTEVACRTLKSAGFDVSQVGDRGGSRDKLAQAEDWNGQMLSKRARVKRCERTQT